MNNSVYIRKIMQDIGKILDEKEYTKSYYLLNNIIIKMEDKYNLQEEKIIKQLELILKAIK